MMLLTSPTVRYLDGFSPFHQHFSVHFLHGQASLGRLGELHIGDAFGLFCLLVFDNPNTLNVPKHGEAFPKLIFGYGPTCDHKKPAVGGVIKVFGGLFRGILLHLPFLLN